MNMYYLDTYSFPLPPALKFDDIPDFNIQIYSIL